MGFLKRLFSVGSKKNKKDRPHIVHNVPPVPQLPHLRPLDEEQHEAAAERILRSTLPRNTNGLELDYATLPPIPHPINTVIQTPASSTVSLASSTISQSGTYSVTVHGRRRHASTEFPLANRDLEGEDKRQSLKPAGEDSRVMRLRSDPSVASLLSLYDEHGRLAADAFSNEEPDSPQKPKQIQERAQNRRSGSTLRQLLGGSLDSRGGLDQSEGDISWAERFLAESEGASNSSISSSGTPVTPQEPAFARPEISFVSDDNISIGTYDNPAISSMAVEVDSSFNESQDIHDVPPATSSPSTPRRASQVFGFLMKGKQSKSPGAVNLDRTLPDPPSCFSSPSDENHGDDDDNSFEISRFMPARFSAAPRPIVDVTPKYSRARQQQRPRSAQIDNTQVSANIDKRASQQLRSTFSDDSHDYTLVRKSTLSILDAELQTPVQQQPMDDAKSNDVRVIMTGPTKVIVTAPTPSSHPAHNAPSRIPRGPRTRKGSSGSSTRRRSVLAEVSSNASKVPAAGDPFVIVTPKPIKRGSSTRSPSRRTSFEADREHYISQPVKQHRTGPLPSSSSRQYQREAQFSKENQRRMGLSVQNEIPSTPLRSNTTGSKALHRTAIQQSFGMFHHGPKTPRQGEDLSSEMSPLGRQIMNDVRQQKIRARDAERAKRSNLI